MGWYCLGIFAKAKERCASLHQYSSDLDGTTFLQKALDRHIDAIPQTTADSTPPLPPSALLLPGAARPATDLWRQAGQEIIHMCISEKSILLSWALNNIFMEKFRYCVKKKFLETFLCFAYKVGKAPTFLFAYLLCDGFHSREVSSLRIQYMRRARERNFRC